MAEQVKQYSYTVQALTELATCISTPRFQPYRDRAQNNEVLAMQSYLYNSRVSKSLLYPFNVVEIVLRNAANDVLKADFNQAWHRNPSFTEKLAPKTLALLEEAVKSAKTSNVDDVVAGLSLGFWFHLFRSNHYPLWKDRFQRVVRSSPTLEFSEFEPRLRRIWGMRNRIAHHEGVLALPSYKSPSAVLDDILFVTSAISKDAAEWLASHATLGRALRSKPQADGAVGPTVGERSDDRFDVVDKATLLSQLSPARISVVIDAETIHGVIGGKEIAEYIFACVDSDGLIATNEHTVADLLSDGGGAGKFSVLHEKLPFGDLHESIAKMRYAVVLSVTGTVKGVIAAAHRRY